MYVLTLVLPTILTCNSTITVALRLVYLYKQQFSIPPYSPYYKIFLDMVPSSSALAVDIGKMLVSEFAFLAPLEISEFWCILKITQ